MYLTKDDKGAITAIYSGNVSRIKDPIEVPDSFVGVVGQNVGEFDAQWEPLPLSQRIAAGFVSVPSGMKLVGDEIEPMTDVELMVAGIEPLPPGTKIVDGVLADMTLAELVAAGQLSQAEADAITKGQKTANQLQQTMQYALQGFQIVMAEVDYLRPASKPASPAWTAMMVKIKQLSDLVG